MSTDQLRDMADAAYRALLAAAEQASAEVQAQRDEWIAMDYIIAETQAWNAVKRAARERARKGVTR